MSRSRTIILIAGAIFCALLVMFNFDVGMVAAALALTAVFSLAALVSPWWPF